MNAMFPDSVKTDIATYRMAVLNYLEANYPLPGSRTWICEITGPDNANHNYMASIYGGAWPKQAGGQAAGGNTPIEALDYALGWPFDPAAVIKQAIDGDAAVARRAAEAAAAAIRQAEVDAALAKQYADQQALDRANAAAEAAANAEAQRQALAAQQAADFAKRQAEAQQQKQTQAPPMSNIIIEAPPSTRKPDELDTGGGAVPVIPTVSSIGTMPKDAFEPGSALDAVPPIATDTIGQQQFEAAAMPPDAFTSDATTATKKQDEDVETGSKPRSDATQDSTTTGIFGLAVIAFVVWLIFGWR